MTSSVYIKKRLEQPNLWSFGGLPGETMGGWEDHYVRTFGECHPDFTAIPLGHVDGVKVCVRRTDTCERRFGDTAFLEQKAREQEQQGYWRASVNLYDPTLSAPVQKWNPQYFSSRRMPGEQDLLRADYLRWPVKYNATGIKLMHSPHQGPDVNQPYEQYGYSFTPKENCDPFSDTWDPRVATSPSQSLPEIKYDVTRLHQPYTLWKSEQKYMGVNQNKYDDTYFERII